jgi:hypothetical protein
MLEPRHITSIRSAANMRRITALIAAWEFIRARLKLRIHASEKGRRLR